MIPAAVTFWPSLTETRGKHQETNWGALFDRFSEWRPFVENQPGWSAATFQPCERGAANVRSVGAVVLDYDGTCNIDVAEALWAEFYGFIHTTRKHSPDAHRFRVILPFGRTVSPFEYAAIWRRINARAGGKLDPAPKDPSRFWFVPGSPDRETFEARYLRGQVMDPDDVLAWPEPVAESNVIPLHRATTDATSAERRASAYLARMPEAISGSGGHQALWAATLAVVRGFGLGESDALALLEREYNPRCSPPWSRRELEHKVRDASRGARVPVGYKLDEGRDWQPTRARATSPKALPTPAPEPAHDEHGEVCAAPAPPAPADPAVKLYSVRTVAEILGNVYRKATGPTREKGVSSGSAIIDKLLGGFRKGRVTVLGAQTSWGKSSFAVMVSDVGLRAGRRVLLVSGEDTEDTYGQRMLCRRANVNALRMRDGELLHEEMRRALAAVDRAEPLPYFLDGIGKKAEYLAAAIQHIASEEPIDLVIVDYLQAFTCAKKCQDRRNELTHIARVFTDAIKGSNAAGLVFSQIKRLPDGQIPTKHDLKESGDVENMAEHVLLGFSKRPDVTDQEQADHLTTRHILIDKNKDGPVLPQPLDMPFDFITANFYESDERGSILPMGDEP